MKAQNVTFEAYKQAVRYGLIKESDIKEAERLMKEYEPDFRTFYDDGWSVGGTIAAILMGY